MNNERVGRFAYIENETPALVAALRGSAQYPTAEGTAFVYWLPVGFYMVMEMKGVPQSQIFGLHIHDGKVCAPIVGEAFSQAGKHLDNCGEGTWCGQHPYHAGDMLPIFSDADGNASMQVFIDRAELDEIAQKPLVLHRMPDDFTTQPSGASGIRIACGVLAHNI